MRGIKATWVEEKGAGFYSDIFQQIFAELVIEELGKIIGKLLICSCMIQLIRRRVND